MMKNGEKKSSKAGRYYFSFCLAPSAQNPSESELSMCRRVSPPCPNYSPVLFCSFGVLHSWYRLAVSRGSCNVTRPPAAHWKHMVALQEAGHILWSWLCACVCVLGWKPWQLVHQPPLSLLMPGTAPAGAKHAEHLERWVCDQKLGKPEVIIHAGW